METIEKGSRDNEDWYFITLESILNPTGETSIQFPNEEANWYCIRSTPDVHRMSLSSSLASALTIALCKKSSVALNLQRTKQGKPGCVAGDGNHVFHPRMYLTHTLEFIHFVLMPRPNLSSNTFSICRNSLKCLKRSTSNHLTFFSLQKLNMVHTAHVLQTVWVAEYTRQNYSVEPC